MHRRCATLIVLACLMAAVPAPAAPKKALFDNTHAETAGNADWQIDTDQPVPSPAQSGITWATPRTIWLGAISSWAVDLVKRGYEVATLTTAFGISYGNAGNLYDLSKYDVFIVDEPNTRFTSAESTAIFDYVRDGGGLVAVADHANSDRNGDGVDSPKAWGRLDRQHLFGAHFDSTGEANNNFSQDSGNVDTSPTNPIVHGVNGVGDSLSFHGGTSLTLFPAANPNVRGDVWMNGLAHGNSGVMAAHSTYGLGRIFFVGDSSPCDDGSAAPGNSNIFDGWAEVSGRDSLLFMNGTMWVTRQSVQRHPAGRHRHLARRRRVVGGRFDPRGHLDGHRRRRRRFGQRRLLPARLGRTLAAGAARTGQRRLVLLDDPGAGERQRAGPGDGLGSDRQRRQRRRQRALPDRARFVGRPGGERGRGLVRGGAADSESESIGGPDPVLAGPERLRRRAGARRGRPADPPLRRGEPAGG